MESRQSGSRQIGSRQTGTRQTERAKLARNPPVERLFSIAGKIFRPERCRLADKHFQQLMFLRCNGRYMNYEDRKYLYLFESMSV